MKVKVIESDFSQWTKKNSDLITEGGIKFEASKRKTLCAAYSVPATLIGIDNKYKTDTLTEVLNLVIKDPVKLLINEDNNDVLSVINPNSVFIDDNTFDSFIQDTEKAVGIKAIVSTNTAGEKFATFPIEIEDKDNFFGDVYQKRIILTRLNCGGLALDTSMLRLICTNGAMVADKQFRSVSRKAVFSDAEVRKYTSDLLALKIADYMKSLWTYKGELIQASVADFMEMNTFLSKNVDPDTADLFLPTAPIEKFYEDQQIDLSTLPLSLKSKLPSGLDFYSCYNILTNGIKKAGVLERQQEIAMADLARPSRIHQISQTNIMVKGKPQFDQKKVKELMGDTAV